MPARLEIQLKSELIDAEGMSISRKASAYFGLTVTDTRVMRVLTIDADLKGDQLERIRTEIFTNPVTEESSFFPLANNFRLDNMGRPQARGQGSSRQHSG